MTRLAWFAGSTAPALALVLSSACGSDDASPPVATPSDATAADVPTEVGVDAADPQCVVQPSLLTTHPHAAQQPTEIGQGLIDVRGWHGRVYFAYGDLDKNTGPIVVSSYDPAAKTWQDHLTFDTERIERFHAIGDNLWAPAADPHGPASAPEYAVGTVDHQWKQIDIGPSNHVNDAIERVPGEVLLTGSAWINEAARLGGGAVWRSVDGGPFTQIFPLLDDAGAPTLFDGIFVPFMGAALNGTAYMTGVGPAWTFDGGEWAYGAPLNDFFRPVDFAGRLVFGVAGELWSSSDGATRQRLGVRLFDTPQTYQFLAEPLPIFQASEGHLLAVDATGTALVTTDLVSWTCLGKAPPDVRSIGSIGGVVYFGGAAGRVYAYEKPSW